MKRTRMGQRIAGVLGVGALAVLAACGSGGGGTTPTGEPTQTGAVNGGTLTVGVLQEPTSFLAAGIVNSMTYSYAVDAPVVEGLLWYRSKDETQNAKTLADFWRPALATEVPTTANGDVRTSGCKNVTFGGKEQTPKMCVTWKLRDGVLWHDGTAFSSKDVCDTFAFFWQKYQTKNPTNVQNPTGWQETIGCDDSNRLQAVVSYRSTYGGYLSQATGVYGILPSKLLQNAFAGAGGAGSDLEKTPQTVNLTLGSGNTDAYTGTETLDKMIDGTGPYVFQKYEPGKDIILVRNKKYWDSRHQPHLDKIIMKIVSDTKAQLDQARAGEIQFGMDYRLALLKDLNDTAKNGKLRVQTIPELGAEKIDFNLCDNAKGLCGDQATKSPFTADLKVRQAMIKAINRDLIVKSIAAGETVVPQDAWIYLGAEFIRTTPSEDPTTGYDPAGAIKILEDAGYKLNPSCHGGLGRANSSGRCWTSTSSPPPATPPARTPRSPSRRTSRRWASTPTSATSSRASSSATSPTAACSTPTSSSWRCTPTPCPRRPNRTAGTRATTPTAAAAARSSTRSRRRRTAASARTTPVRTTPTSTSSSTRPAPPST